MIDLRIKNRPLDLDPDTSISMEINNPVFAGDIFPGSFSMPFTIPASATNGKILGFPELVHLAQKPKLRYEAELIVEGIPALSGELIFRGFSNDKYKVNFQSQISLLGQFFNNVSLRGLNHEVTKLLEWSEEGGSPWSYLYGGKYIGVTINYLDFPTPFSVTVNGETFEDDNENAALAYNSVLEQINASDTGVKVSYIDFNASTTIYIKFYTEFKGIDQQLEIDLGDDPDNPVWTVVETWYENYQGFIEAGIQALNANVLPTSDFVFPTYYNKKFYDSQDGKFTGIFNEYVDGAFVFKHIDDSSSFVPMFSLAYIFRKIEETTGIKITGDFIADADMQKLIFWNNHSLDYFENTYAETPYHTYYDKIDPRNHIPDMSINEFFIELGKLFSLGFDFDNDAKTLELYFRRDIIKNQDFIDISSKTNPRYEFDYGQNEGYTLVYKWNSKDELFVKDPAEMAPLVIGEGKTKTELKMHTVFTRKSSITYSTVVGGVQNIRSFGRKVPVVEQPGTWAGKAPESDPRLLFFHGFQPDFVGDLYPYASSDNLDYDGNVLGEYSLAWQGTTSLYEEFHRDWIDFLMIDQSITRESYWSIIDLLNYQFKSKYRVDQIRYMIPKISYNVSSRKGLGPVNLDMLKAE